MGREILDLRIGLDVGTSTTKVVIHPLYAGDSFFVVDFGKDKTEDATYLLPTRLAFNMKTKQFELPVYNTEPADNRFFEKLMNKFSKVSIDDKACNQKVLTNLKVNFMNQEPDSEYYLRVFIALVIQYSKDWFIKKYGNIDLVRNKDIVWSINMGIPSATFSIEKDKRYLDLLKTAYNLSKYQRIDLNNYKKADNSDPDIEYYIIPEIVAAVASFVTQEDVAAQRLYCAIDIGAGTTDICTFRIYNNEPTIYSFFNASVLELGSDRYNEAGYKGDIESKFLQQIGSVIWQTKRDMDPYAREWKEYLPLIVCGGGSYIGAYRYVINKYEDFLMRQLSFNGFKGYRDVVLPDTKYEYVSDKIDPKRLLVAQGLSFSDNFCNEYNTQITIMPKKNKKEYEEISKDQM